jgi:hypothetical protein
MSRLQFSLNPHGASQHTQRYEDRLHRIAGAPVTLAGKPAPKSSALLFKTIAALTVAAVLAASLAVWRIYHFPH